MRELHLHLDGSLRPETVEELAKEKNMKIGTLEEIKDKMIVPEDCDSLNEYLERFALPLEFLQNKEWMERIAFELGEDLAKMGLEYGEIRFAPQLHTQEGMSQREAVEAAISGVKKAMETYPSIRLGLILCAMRGDSNEKKNFETLEIAAEMLGDVVCAFDLAGAEALFPTENFENLFAKAKELKVPFTIHAGEAAGPESVWKALEFGAKRIGHGVRSIEDDKLVEYLAEKKIPLEVCIVSNGDTKLVEDLKNHPVKELFDRGVRVTLNSDNNTVSNTNLLKERKIAKECFGFSEEELKQMDNYAKEASFLQ